MPDREADDAEPGTKGGTTAGIKVGMRSSIFTKGGLIAVGGFIAAVIAVVIALLLLRPDRPQQRASELPTTTTGPAPGAAPTEATPNRLWLRGTFKRASRNPHPSGEYTNEDTVTITSDWPGCDAAASSSDGGTAVLHWIGNGWETTASDSCGTHTYTWTPDVVVDGIVQKLSGRWTTRDVVDYLNAHRGLERRLSIRREHGAPTRTRT